MGVEYKDYYELLGVSRTADEKAIKSAFRSLARQYHPDAQGGNEDKFKEINEAYDVLSDSKKRRMYDKLGPNYRHGQGFEPPPDFSQHGFGGGFGQGGFSQADFGGAGGGGAYSDFFDMLFGQAGVNMGGMGQGMGAGGHYGAQSASRQKPPPKENLTVKQVIYLDLEDVAKGSEKKVTLKYSGKTMTVKVPRGIKEGSKIRLSGEGKQGMRGKGDVHLEVRFNRHEQFEIEGERLVYQAKLSPAEMVLGTTAKIPTLFGNSLELTIPAGSQPDKLMRLKGQGMPIKSGQGDLFVRLKVLIPEGESLTDEEKTLYEKLLEL